MAISLSQGMPVLLALPAVLALRWLVIDPADARPASAALAYATPQAGHCQAGAVSVACRTWQHLGQRVVMGLLARVSGYKGDWLWSRGSLALAWSVSGLQCRLHDSLHCLCAQCEPGPFSFGPFSFHFGILSALNSIHQLDTDLPVLPLKGIHRNSLVKTGNALQLCGRRLRHSQN